MDRHPRARMRHRRGGIWTLLAGMALLVLAGCGGGPAPVATTPTDPPTTMAGAAASTSRPTRKGPQRIIVVVEENHSFDQIIGSAQAPFINHLAGQGTLLTGFYGITHPSLPNYVAMVSGDTQGITSDCGDCNVDAANLVDQLEQAGISWTAYMEDLPAPCSDAHTAGPYAKKHDPFMYFASIRDNPARCHKVVPADRLDADLAAGRLPRFVFVTPNQDHDMHGAGQGGDDATLIRTADDWLGALYGKMAGSSAWREDTRLVVTWDEAGGGRRPPAPARSRDQGGTRPAAAHPRGPGPGSHGLG